MDILILEDERRNYNRLKRMLEDRDPACRVFGPLPSIASTLEWFRQHAEPDVILADIRLSDGLSFEALRQVEPSAPVIFTTAYDEYAIQAFKHNGIDYLLKPIDAEELAAALDKVERRRGQGLAFTAELRQLLGQAWAGPRTPGRDRFLLPWQDGYRAVSAREINHIFTEGKVVRFFLSDGSSLPTPFSMEQLEARLDPQSFFRANRQYIIHVDSIAQIRHWFGSKLMVRLKGYPGVEVVVSRERAADFKQWLGQ